jgi:hypothetical protein
MGDVNSIELLVKPLGAYFVSLSGRRKSKVFRVVSERQILMKTKEKGNESRKDTQAARLALNQCHIRKAVILKTYAFFGNDIHR